MNTKTRRIGVIGLVVGVAGAGRIAAALVLSDRPSNSRTPSRPPGQVQQAADRSTTASSAVVENPPPPVVRRIKADDPTYVPPG